MIIRVDSHGTPEQFESLILEMADRDGIKGLLILACDANGFQPETLNPMLRNVPVPLFGGIFPSVIHNRAKLDKGTIVVGLSSKPDVHLVRNLSNPDLDCEAVMEGITPSSGNAKTMFVFVDGYSQRINSLMSSLYTVFGIEYNYIGGGAGSINPEALDMSKTPCLFTNDGLMQDSALLALVDLASGIGVNHGWHKIGGPYRITESEGNAINTIDWRPAFEVYREIIKEHSGETIRTDNFFDVAKRFPFGISRLGSEIIVRDPFTVEGDSIIVATEIPQESFIDTLTGNHESLVTAAEKSLREATETFPGDRPAMIFLIDCISRALFLAEDFTDEIDAVYRKELPLVGALTLGEIANSGKSFMELYNKTCVVGLLG